MIQTYCTTNLQYKHAPSSVAYPELVSRGVSKSRNFKWLVKVGACKDVHPLIKKNSWPGGVSGQPENPPGYATAVTNASTHVQTHTHPDPIFTTNAEHLDCNLLVEHAPFAAS